jgi:flagellar hook-length control protein FliK
MVQALIQTSSPAPDVHSGAMVSGVPDKGFKSVLKTSVSSANSAGSDEDKGKAPEQPSVTKPTVTSAKSVDNQKDAEPSENQVKTEQPKQEPKDELQQIIAEMTAVAQQMLNAPQAKDISAMMTALMGQPENTLSQQSPNGQLLQNIAGDQQSQGNGTGLWGAINQNAVGAADKAAGNTKNSLMDMAGKSFQDAQSNNPQAPADALKPDAAPDFSALISKNQALLSKTDDTFNDALSQLKDGLSSDRQAGEVKSSKDAAGVYNQFIQVQPASGRTMPVQETIPANRINTIDEVISKAVSSGQKEIVLRLDPPDLGSIHIRLSYDNGLLKADVKVDSSMVKDNFMNAMPQIKNALESAGIKASQFNVDVRDDQGRQGQNNNNQNRQQQQRQAGEFSNAFSDFFA